MSYIIRSFRGQVYAADYKEAEEKAKGLLLDIMTDGFDCQFWWVRVMDTRLMRFRLICCYKVGFWHLSRWFKYEEDF